MTVPATKARRWMCLPTALLHYYRPARSNSRHCCPMTKGAGNMYALNVRFPVHCRLNADMISLLRAMSHASYRTNSHEQDG